MGPTFRQKIGRLINVLFHKTISELTLFQYQKERPRLLLPRQDKFGGSWRRKVQESKKNPFSDGGSISAPAFPKQA